MEYTNIQRDTSMSNPQEEPVGNLLEMNAQASNKFGFTVDPAALGELSQQLMSEAKLFNKEYTRYKNAYFSQLDNEVL